MISNIEFPERDSDFEALLAATIAAAIGSMAVVHRYQMGLSEVQRLTDKHDRSILTTVDFESEKVAKDILQARFPDVPILAEETGLSDATESPHIFMVDPIDGTRPFLNGGSSSTVIAALYNVVARRLEAVTVGEPATGRLWTSDGIRTTRQIINSQTGQAITQPIERHVWNGEWTDNGTVLIENFAAFSRGDRQILDNNNLIRLFANLQGKIAIQNYGTNGLHHALVANGGERMAGAITTSMGGEWDTGGVLAVLAAGGVAQGFRAVRGRSLEQGLDPLDPFKYDMVISANNADTLEFLSESLLNAWYMRDSQYSGTGRAQ